jgi:hypothetical protein
MSLSFDLYVALAYYMLPVSRFLSDLTSKRLGGKANSDQL